MGMRCHSKMLLVAAVSLIIAIPGFAEELKPLDEARLLGRVRAACLRPVSFDAEAMRRPLRLDPAADLKSARAEVAEKPTDLQAHWNLAVAADAVGAPDAVTEWQVAAAMIETQLRGKAPASDLPEKLVVALIGSNAGLRAVPAAEKLRAAQPQSWRASLLCGDAYFRRADFNWRVASRLIRPNATPPPALTQFREDLVAARKAYDRAVDLAPPELAPRAGRIALELARPLLAGLLPPGTLAGSDRSDLDLVRSDLLQVAKRCGAAGLWHAAAYFVERPGELAALSSEQRMSLERLLSAPAPETDKVAAAEARGMWRVALGKPGEARKDFEIAAAAASERRIAAGWLAWLDTHLGVDRTATLSRLRDHLKTAPNAEEDAAVAALLCGENLTEALVAAREAVKLSVNSVSARYLLAFLLIRKDPNAQEARYHLGQLKNLEPDDAEATFFMLIVTAMDGNREAARLALQDLVGTPTVDDDLRNRIKETLLDLASK